MAINVEIQFLLIISVKKEELKCLFNEINPINPVPKQMFLVLDHLICINKMSAKLPLLQQCEAVSFHKSVTKRTK